MLVQYMSDLHLEFADYRPRPVAKTLVLAGDVMVYHQFENNSSRRRRYKEFFEYVNEAFQNTVYILGNHEWYFWLDTPSLVGEVRRAMKAYKNIHFLENDYVDVNGVRFVGGTLWTDFFGASEPHMDLALRCMNDFKTTRLTPEYVADLHEETLEYLKGKMTDNTVVVTHHAPSALSSHPMYAGEKLNAAFYSNLDDTVKLLNPRFWVHGHMHHPSAYFLGETKVLCNPRGYPNEDSRFDEEKCFVC